MKSNEIWLEGQELEIKKYRKLYQIYGNTYGEALDAEHFVVPNFVGRSIWGISNVEQFGYIEGGIPDHFHYVDNMPNTLNRPRGDDRTNCTTYYLTSRTRMASETNSTYGNVDYDTQVRPTSVAVRVKTRAK